MNKSVMKCCICNNENIGQFITINNKKYHLCCIEQLQQENKKINGTIQTYDILLKANVEENKKLKDNWNYIKKMLKEVRQEKFNVNGYCGTCTDVDIDFLLNKMQELEKGCDSNEITRI